MTNSEPRLPGRHIVIHTDGSCIGNPGPGGWGVILQSMEGPTELARKELKGHQRQTTNNQMELTAVIKALEAIKSDNPIILKSDSQYVVRGITQWIVGWKANGWRTASKKPVSNVELWQTLDELASRRKVTWEWTRGHAGDPLNEEVDRLANAAARKASVG